HDASTCGVTACAVTTNVSQPARRAAPRGPVALARRARACDAAHACTNVPKLRLPRALRARTRWLRTRVSDVSHRARRDGCTSATHAASCSRGGTRARTADA